MENGRITRRRGFGFLLRLLAGVCLVGLAEFSPSPSFNGLIPWPITPNWAMGYARWLSLSVRARAGVLWRRRQPRCPRSPHRRLAAMTRRPEPRLVRSLATATASPAAPVPPQASKPPRAAAPFLAVLLRRGRAAAALLLNRHLRAAPASEARSLLSALPAVRDAVSYNTVISALCCRSGGDLPAALALLRDMSREPHPGARPNAVSYTAVMRGLCAARRTDEAVGLLRDMQARGVRPDVVTYGTLIQGLCDASEVDGAVELLNEMCASGIEPGVVVYSCLLRGYCKSGRWQDVGKVFEEMSQRRIEPDAIMFTGLIDSLCKKGNTRKASKVKDMMVERGLKPDAVTYNVLINVLCKEGLMREAMTLKKEMLEKGVTPTIVTYNILIRALSGVLEMDEAMGLLEEMIQGDIALEPDVITLLAEQELAAFRPPPCALLYCSVCSSTTERAPGIELVSQPPPIPAIIGDETCVLLVSNTSIVKTCPCRNATTAATVTSNSLPIEVSLELAPPPLPSTLAVYFPGADPGAAHSKILFAGDDLVLLRVSSRRRTATPLKNFDYFVYRAGAGARHERRPSSLTLIPNPEPGGFFVRDGALGVLPRGGGGLYTIAALLVTGVDEYELRRFDCEVGRWVSMAVSLESPRRPFPSNFRARRPRHHGTSMAITPGTMGWVDLWGGILFCDLLREDRDRPVLRLSGTYHCHCRLTSLRLKIRRSRRRVFSLIKNGKAWLELADLQMTSEHLPYTDIETGWPAFAVANWAITLLKSGLLQRKPSRDEEEDVVEIALHNLVVFEPNVSLNG
nr:unnamed protein product [Digitaria exilis]